MPAISYAKAKELNLLTESEMTRIVQVALAMGDDFKPSSKAFQIVAAQGGTASVPSVNRMFRQVLQKLRDKGCEIPDDDDAATPGTDATAAPKAKPGRKRKADAGDGEDGVSKKATKDKKAMADKVEAGGEEGGGPKKAKKSKKAMEGKDGAGAEEESAPKKATKSRKAGEGKKDTESKTVKMEEVVDEDNI